MQAYSLWA